MLQSLIQKMLLKTDPETAHTVAKQLINLRYGCDRCADVIQQPTTVFGLTFPNPVGLAAGWDKDAVCFDALLRMGFGFVEVGTVTPKPQVGNPKPRLFRLPEKQALINRMGFNNAGIEALTERIKNRKAKGILGVNIGKNKETPLDRAAEDYEICLTAVYPYADYIVVNISSPNTEGLRDLQSDQYLPDLLKTLKTAANLLSAKSNRNVPLLVKTSVDLPIEYREFFIHTVSDHNIDGIIISNSTVMHHELEKGGLSGQPLRERTTEMIKIFHQLNPKMPIIGVGGILSGKDANAHRGAGASLVQIFTGFVYRGPGLIKEILSERFG
ncbi:MAG: dihydroorotate dehydrogenase (quinone) [Gammaproteobacteria bacterium RIFCSPHIGHO2_12_FULL_42_13]|nr:MAG: dihydroorotate dehydrogenase (quinone) [Gammaproteobacteria bacterium RIFCSPHIGHO2_12_FULL_42_13]